MDPEMLLYWETVEEFYTNEIMLHQFFNPLRGLEEEFVDGPILELGCGQSSFLIEYSKSGRELYAVDNEAYQLKSLHKRISEYCPENIDNLNLCDLTILQHKLPEKNFALIILSNILHFFNFEECKKLINQLNERSVSGSFILVNVHSEKSKYNNLEDPNNLSYFKHFFSENDLKLLFPESDFEEMLFADIKEKESKLGRIITQRWVEKTLDRKQIFDEEIRANEIEINLKDNVQHNLIAVFRKK